MTVSAAYVYYPYSPQLKAQDLLAKAAACASDTYEFLSDLRIKTHNRESVGPLHSKWLSIKSDVTTFVSTVAFLVDPILANLAERLQATCIHVESAFTRIHTIQPIFIDLGVIQEKWNLLQQCAHLDDKETRTRLTQTTCFEIRALFADVQHRIYAVGYPILVNPQTDFDRLHTSYKEFDDGLVSQGVLPPENPILSDSSS